MAIPQKKTIKKQPATKLNKAAPKKTAVQKEAEPKSGIKKEYIKEKNICNVTFQFPKVAATNAKSVCVVGDFNNWNIHEHPMKKMKDGNFSITIPLTPGREYQYRYLIDENIWENDWNADKYVKSPYGDTDNSAVIV